MTDVETEIHDALRAQGLVVAAEDIPLIACSVDYRTKLREALGDFVSHADRIHELERELNEAQDEWRIADRLVDKLKDDLAEVESERDKLKATNTRLTEWNEAAATMIENLTEKLKGKEDADHPT